MTSKATGASARETTPTVVISLVTFNGRRWLDGCLASIRAQDLADWRLLIVDNASTDGSWELLRAATEGDGRVVLERLPTNVGFAAAHNRNIRCSSAPYIVLLNQDVELDPAFLRHVVTAFSGRPSVGAVQGRIRRLGDDGSRSMTLDSTGLVMDRGRRAVARCQDQIETSGHLIAGDVWGVDGPVAAYRASALADAAPPSVVPLASGGREVLDEDFFMYKEDVDLAWRLRLLGWSAWYEPAALAWHARSVRSGQPVPRWIRMASWRNQHLMQVKNESLAAFVRDAPWVLLREALTLGRLLLTDIRRLEVVPDLLRALPRAMRKRRALARRISARGRASTGVSRNPGT